jgi:DNA-binding CsgD family transcriptional regulator
VTELLERDGELALVEHALDLGRAGQGSALIIRGPAGIGKSSLLAAARVTAQAAGARVLRARGGELERDFGFGVVRQLFEPALAAASAAERAEWLKGAAGNAARLLGLPGAGAVPAGVAGPSDPSFAVLHGLYWLCAQLADAGPVCLLVDDAQWADTASLRYLAFLLPRLEDLPVTVLLAVRVGEEGPDAGLLESLAANPAAGLVEPSPLSQDAVGQLVAAALGEPLDSALAADCYRATGGLPFLVEQLACRLLDKGAGSLVTRPQPVEAMGGPTVARWVLLRLARLGRPAARLARAVAILESGELAQAAELAGLDHDDAAAARDMLSSAGILARGRPLAFAHPIVRRAVYDAMTDAERAAGHRKAARLLAAAGRPDELVAEHLLAAEPAGDPWVVDRLARAASTMSRTGAAESATAYLRRALGEPPPPQHRSGILLQLGFAEFNAGRAGAIAHLEQSVDTAADGPARATCALALVFALAATHDHRLAGSVRVLDEAIASLGGNDRALERSIETMAVAVTAVDPDLAPKSRARRRAVRLRADADPAPSRETLALASLIAVMTNEPAQVAADLARRSLHAEPEPLPGPVVLPWQPLQQAVTALVWSGCHAEAQTVLNAAIGDARNAGDAVLMASLHAHRACLALDRGDLRGAEADARTTLESAGLSAPGTFRLRNAALAIQALTEQGQLEEAERLLLPIDHAIEGSAGMDTRLRLSRGQLRMAQLRPDAALADFLAAGEVATRLGLDSPSWLPWRSCAALASLALGDQDRAHGLAAGELGLARAFGAPRTLGVALHAAGLTSGGDCGERLLREAITALDRAGASLDRARAMCELGARLRRGGRRAESRELLREALDFAHRAGAAPLAARAETELRATGARPRRAVLSGADALTASERRIAELAADGLTNRQIAQTLFITARTVESHLTSIFRKLGIESREKLRTALLSSGRRRAASARAPRARTTVPGRSDCALMCDLSRL